MRYKLKQIHCRPWRRPLGTKADDSRTAFDDFGFGPLGTQPATERA